jgi:branched-chain amino acid transport system ATP-binding protein
VNAARKAPMLELEGVTKTFGGVVANDAISLTVEEGAIVGLIGPNGSGKTTLFNAITGALPIDAGAIRFKGREISGLLAGDIARAGIIRTFQQPRIYARMTALDNMLVSASARATRFGRLFARAEDADGVARARELLDFVGLDAKRDLLAGDLSFGQQKLLELAMALINNPEMLLLDEPTAGINPILVESLIDRLKAANAERGLTLLVIEHNMPVIMGLAQHIYCLAHGRLLAEGPPDKVRQDKNVLDAYLGAS